MQDNTLRAGALLNREEHEGREEAVGVDPKRVAIPERDDFREQNLKKLEERRRSLMSDLLHVLYQEVLLRGENKVQDRLHSQHAPYHYLDVSFYPTEEAK